MTARQAVYALADQLDDVGDDLQQLSCWIAVAAFEIRHERDHTRDGVGLDRIEIQSLDNVRRGKARQINGGIGCMGHGAHVGRGSWDALPPAFVEAASTNAKPSFQD